MRLIDKNKTITTHSSSCLSFQSSRDIKAYFSPSSQKIDSYSDGRKKSFVSTLSDLPLRSLRRGSNPLLTPPPPQPHPKKAERVRENHNCENRIKRDYLFHETTADGRSTSVSFFSLLSATKENNQFLRIHVVTQLGTDFSSSSSSYKGRSYTQLPALRRGLDDDWLRISLINDPRFIAQDRF